MVYDDDEERSGLEKAGRVRRNRSGGRRWRWTGSLRQRARAAQRVPQAVFKISSYAHSGGVLWDRVNYVARDGELEVEGPQGRQYETLAELEQLVADWERDGGAHNRRVVAMSAVVSFPAGVDQQRATEAARQFFEAAFAENHGYVFAPHTDATHFHVHVVVQAAGHDGTQLRITRDDLQGLRLLFAEKAAEQGIELDASPRVARGLEAERSPSRTVEGMARRGVEPTRLRRAVLKSQVARAAVAEERASRRQEPTVNKSRALEYARAAATLAVGLSERTGDSEKVAAIQGAVELGCCGLALADTSRANKQTIEQAREIIWRAQRVIHDHIQSIAGGQAKQAAIRANRRLSRELTAYRQERQQRAAQEREVRAVQERQAAELENDGPDL